MKSNPLLKLQRPNEDKLENDDIVSRILWQRGIRSENQVKRFLEPERGDLLDPFLLKGMEKAVALIDQALREGRRICVYGDYDVDGMVSTSLMMRFFQDQGFQIQHYIPSRHEEGYGLNAKAIQELAGEGVDLLITVDCGITSVDEIDLAKSLGMQVVLTDHHQCPEVLPAADAIINPHQPGCPYPNKNLCGAGVAFKWIQGYTQFKELEMNYERYLPFAALATVADVVKLMGENRVIVKLGLPLMEASDIAGFQALLKECEIQKGQLNAGHLGFQLAPRLNAVGRLENAELAIRLLVTDEDEAAAAAARVLSDLNEERKRLEKNMMEAAVRQVEAWPEGLPDFILVQGAHWNEGVIGIVASRLVERYYRPVLVLALTDEGIAKGSARSIAGLNMFEALSAQGDLLLKFGGHAQAAGLSVSIKDIDALKMRLNDYTRARLAPLDFQPEISLDCQLDVSQVNKELIQDLDRIAPFGYGNPRPVAFIPQTEIQSLRVIGKGREHVAGAVGNAFDPPLAFVGFHQADLATKMESGEQVDLAATLGVNCFRGRETLQLQLKTVCSLDRLLVEHFDRGGDALAEHIFQFPNFLKYDKITWLTTKPYFDLENLKQRNLVLIDSLETWLEMKDEVRLMGRECLKSHRFCMGSPDADIPGWHYLYAPKAAALDQEWDQCFRAGKADSSFFTELSDVETLRIIYRWILEQMPQGRISVLNLYRNMQLNREYPLETGLIALWIFLDVGFFVRSGDHLERVRQMKKINLDQHPLMQKIKQIKKEKSH